MAKFGAAKSDRLNRIGATVVAAFAAQYGFAQDQVAGQEDPQLIEEIIVTATRRASSVQDIPFNIAAISGEILERQRVSQLAELSRHLPGLIHIDQGDRATSRMTVRGLNVASMNEETLLFNTSGDIVATYVGDIPLYIDFRLEDLDRVEVLFGPQGTLYGASTLGGAIRYIPNAPNTTDWEASISVTGFGISESDSIGSDVLGVINMPLLDGRLGLRASMSNYNDPGFIDNSMLVRDPGVSNPNPDFDDPADVAANLLTTDDANANEILSGRAALLWDISESVTATLSYFFQENQSDGRTINHRHALGTGKYESGHRFPEPNERKNQLASLEIAADLGFADLVSATGVSRYDELGQRDQTDLVLVLEPAVHQDFPNFVHFTRDETEEERINQELRLVSSHDGSWSWLVGAFFNHYEFRHDFRGFSPGYPEFIGVIRPDNLEIIIQLEEELREAALFGEVGYNVNENLQLSFGMRRYTITRDSGNGTDFPLFLTELGVYGPDEENVMVQSFTNDDDGTLFKFNASYRFNIDLMSYVTISEGFRLGGVNPFPRCSDGGPAIVFGCLEPNEETYLSDTTINYEIGVRSAWMGGRLMLNAALFHIDWNDIQLEAVSVDGFFITTNGGDAESQGLEVATQAEFSDQWRMSLSYAHNRAKLTSFSPGLVDFVEDGLPGDRLAGTPEHQLSTVLTFSQPLTRGWQLGLDYAFAYTSDVYTKVGLRNNGEVLPGYSLHNLGATFASTNNWTVRLFVDNLLNEFAETNVRNDQSLIQDVGLHPLRQYYRNVIRPRRYGLEVRYDFDL